MNIPAWLPDILAAAMLVITAYSLWRLVIALRWGRPTDYEAYEADAFHAGTGIAVAGLLVGWMATLPRELWTDVYLGAAIWFISRVVMARRDGAGRGEVGGLAAYAGASVVLVYMYMAGVGPSPLSGSSAGASTTAGMSGMANGGAIGSPTLGVVLAVAMVGCAVVVLDRIAPASFGTGADAAADPGSGAMAAARRVALAPAAVECCRIVLAITMAYAIFTRLG